MINIVEKISIIIPIYNVSSSLKRCLNSVINQTYRNIEIICVNDGSSDDSLKILKEFEKKDNRIIVIDKKNEGVSIARNVGIEKSTGEYITFVDSDDWLELNALEVLYNTIISEKVDVVRGSYFRNYNFSSDSIEVDELFELKNKRVKVSNNLLFTSFLEKIINGKINCFVWLLLIKNNILKNVELFDQKIYLMEDSIFYFDLINNIDSIYFLNIPIYHYYLNPQSATKASGYYVRNMYNVLDVNESIINKLKEGKFYSVERQKLLNNSHLNIIESYVFIMYKNSLKDKKELKNIILNIVKDERIIKMFNESNIKTLPKYIKIPLILIKKKKIKALFVFYFIRKIMSNIKTLITKRKE